MSARRPRVAVLGGGMGGLAAAWRLSEPGWRDRFGSIVVYQRGWRLGGKGASSRGRHGRIEEHGLHVWLGFYENAFRLVRECYDELDRPATDPGAPLRTWRDAFEPAPVVGVAERDGDDWYHWLARFAPNDLEPGGDPDPDPADATEFVRRGLRLVLDVVDSLVAMPDGGGSGRVVLSASADPPPGFGDACDVGGDGAVGPGAVPGAVPGLGGDTLIAAASVAGPAAAIEVVRLVRRALLALDPDGGVDRDRVDDRVGAGAAWTLLGAVDGLDRAQQVLADAADTDPRVQRSWQLVSLTLALVRGVVADGVLTDPGALTRLDDEDYRDWIRRHGAAPAAVDGAFLRGLYDLVIAYEGGDRARPAFGAGTALLLAMKLALEYKGAVFWKMRAGMGDVVFGPLYQALRARGVEFEFFHRLDGLHLSADRTVVETITVGRQVRLAAGLERYEPLVRVGGLPCFPVGPLADQLDAGNADEALDTGDAADAIDGAVDGGVDDAGRSFEVHDGGRPDAEQRLLRRGIDFDLAVLAVPPPMAGLVGRELLADRVEWRDMVANIATVATQAFQLWLRAPEHALGWPRPGTTVSGFTVPFDTWASMPQLLDAEDWPAADRPAAVAYFCGALAAAWPPPDGVAGPAYRREQRETVGAGVLAFLTGELGHLLPGAVEGQGFRWDLLCGGRGRTGRSALDSQYWTANVDPSDRYVQSLPGTSRYRLRPDESGYDNLVLAGDWTDSGLNAGCIEAAVLSGLQAANALLGRARHHRLTGYLPG